VPCWWHGLILCCWLELAGFPLRAEAVGSASCPSPPGGYPYRSGCNRALVWEKVYLQDASVLLIWMTLGCPLLQMSRSEPSSGKATVFPSWWPNPSWRASQSTEWPPVGFKVEQVAEAELGRGENGIRGRAQCRARQSLHSRAGLPFYRIRCPVKGWQAAFTQSGACVIMLLALDKTVVLLLLCTYSVV
jgi:hypothetical protein